MSVHLGQHTYPHFLTQYTQLYYFDAKYFCAILQTELHHRGGVELQKVPDDPAERVRITLEKGGAVAVVGWIESNHDDFTRRLPERWVVFQSATAVGIPAFVRCILFTKYVPEEAARQIRLQNFGKCHRDPLEVDRIRHFLKGCRDLFERLAAAPPGAQAERRHEMSNELLDFLTQRREQEMSNMDEFVAAFLKEAQVNRDVPGTVGKKILGKLRQQFGITESTQDLARNGWIEGVKKDGSTQVGYWRAGQKMKAAAETEQFEPTDPHELLAYLIAQRPTIEAEMQRVEAEYRESKGKLQARLARVENAERLDRELHQLAKKPES